MANGVRSFLKHLGKVILVLASLAVVYTVAMAAAHAAGPDLRWPILAPRTGTLETYVVSGWSTAPYQPLFWIACAVVFALYNALTHEIEPVK